MAGALVIGSGGRGHAPAWRTAKSGMVGGVYGPGQRRLPQRHTRADDIGGPADFAAKRYCTVECTEAPLAAGAVDAFAERGLGMFGPTRAAARLEYSKAWAKGFMGRHGIRTARSATFGDAEEASDCVDSAEHDTVVKADGRAAGKGVVVCNGRREARDAIHDTMIRGRFDQACGTAAAEERLQDVDASCIAGCDGSAAVPPASIQDRKRIFDNGRGPSTGGTGAYSPAPHANGETPDTAQKEIVGRTLAGMGRQGCSLTGFPYVGAAVCDGVPHMPEYVRMGDPECRSIVARMDFDLYEHAKAAASGGLGRCLRPGRRPGMRHAWRLPPEGIRVHTQRAAPSPHPRPNTTRRYSMRGPPPKAANSHPTAVGCWAQPTWEGRCAKRYRGHAVQPLPYTGAASTADWT